MDAIDLFAGFGGFSTGAAAAGARVLWAANHWPEAVYWHRQNHPETEHVCQDLHQANWAQVPAHDLLLASPCCQGHSKARGKKSNNPEHDSSRSTAWAVVSAAEYHRPAVVLVENVPEFLQWSLYPAWEHAMRALGYSLAPHIVDAADLGVPQHRVRLFLVATKSKSPVQLRLPKLPHVPAKSFIDWDGGDWTQIRKPGRAKATLARCFRGWRDLKTGRFLIPYYGSGSGLTGRCPNRPIGTITTLDRWAVVKGNQMRMLTLNEVMAAMTFPAEMKRPATRRLAIHLAGNAVPPICAQRLVTAIKQVA